jgi:hypothetical protein
VGSEVLERGENAKSSVVVKVRMEVPQSMLMWCSSVCSRQSRIESSCWDRLSQVDSMSETKRTRRSDITMIAVTDNDSHGASGKGHKIGIENEKVVGGAEDLGVACD